ncbi:MAG: hypothetical protein Q7T38_03440 [Gallionella sp.]|nr:hypothetical protein [Gallionella sp.]
MSENNKKSLARFINPTEQDLWAKLMELHDVLDIIKKRTDLNADQVEILIKCYDKLDMAKEALGPKWKGFPWLPNLKKHYKIFWSLVHRVDEDIILLLPDDEVASKAIDVATFFSMNIKEVRIREEWLGGSGKPGKLSNAIEKYSAGKDMPGNRLIIREALKLVNDLMDHNFWILSLNSLVSMLSATLLGIAMLVFWVCDYPLQLVNWPGSINEVFAPLALLGLMGAYLSNLITREDFLFVKGPFWRYMLHYVLSKPIISAFAAVFIYVVEQSRLVFAVVTTATVQLPASQLITVHVNQNAVGYVYAILAVASGFSADKILRSMIDRVLKKLEKTAEKTKETKNES